MAKRIYVGSLPYSITDEQLSSLFGPYGTVRDAQVITDRYTGQSRGFGFVEMEDDSQAEAAIAALNGTSHGGRSLVVNEAKQRESRGGEGARYAASSGAYGDYERDNRSRGR